MIAVAMVKTLARGKPEAEEATQIRRLYVYLADIGDKLTPSQRMRYSSMRMAADTASAGEMVALQRRASFFGFSEQPPADWKPEDSVVLKSSRERHDDDVELDREASVLVSQGKFADALALLTPAEASMRRRMANSWLLVRFLSALGNAQLGVHDLPAAEKALRDACDIAANFGPASTEGRDCARSRVNLYTAWNKTDPEKGYDAKLDEWQKRLATYEAAKNE
jgi:hypothetical protein